MNVWNSSERFPKGQICTFFPYEQTNSSKEMPWSSLIHTIFSLWGLEKSVLIACQGFQWLTVGTIIPQPRVRHELSQECCCLMWRDDMLEWSCLPSTSVFLLCFQVIPGIGLLAFCLKRKKEKRRGMEEECYAVSQPIIPSFSRARCTMPALRSVASFTSFSFVGSNRMITWKFPSPACAIIVLPTWTWFIRR